jgi:MFS transporter, DHA2 family, multidrug resistance protein
MILVFAPVAGKLSDRVGSRGFMTAGPALTAAGLALLLHTGPTTPYATVLLPAFLAMGAGWAITLAPMSTAVMGSAGASQAGVASAVANTSREVGGVLGVAALGALTTSVFNSTLLARLTSAGIPAARAARILTRAAATAAAGGSTATDPVVSHAIQSSFIHAMHAGVIAAVIAMLGASLASFAFVRSHRTNPIGGGTDAS